VLARSCLDRSRWVEDHPGSPVDLSVNVSARQLMSGHFPATVDRVLRQTGMDPSALLLEVTEGVLIEDCTEAMTVIAELRETGVRLALDDFGTGYSSLSYLRQLTVHNVKIDRSFIADMEASPAANAVIVSVTNLAHDLGLDVTAEGVETERQHEGVLAAGCDFAQGYYYARPMPADALGALLGAGVPPELPVSTGALR
jgi:EAL domain-containing protein (putative c-di-GMP-specific phosphodiesterase class I)